MLLLGIDISTTAAKALLINEAGSVVKSFSTPITISQAQPLWSEQAPDEWWRGTVTSTRAVLQDMEPTQVRAIGLTGQMHGLVLLNQSGEVIRPAILWNDQRTAAQCQEIRERIGRERLLEITGNDALPGFTAPKILWVQEHEPANWRETRHVLLPKDYVRYRLTGEYATDRADGSGTLLFDLVKRDWSEEVTTALGIPAHYLPKTYEGPEVTGRLTSGAAAQAVGVGAVEPGIVAITLGTSGVAFATTQQPIVESEGRLHSFCHCVPDRWHLMGVMLSAGGRLRWYRDSMAPGVDFDRLLEPAEAIPAGVAFGLRGGAPGRPGRRRLAGRGEWTWSDFPKDCGHRGVPADATLCGAHVAAGWGGNLLFGCCQGGQNGFEDGLCRFEDVLSRDRLHHQCSIAP